MKEINLLSLVQAYNSLDKGLYNKYIEYTGTILSESEVYDLSSFISIINLPFTDISIFNKYFLGYTIPQISKEFDLLRFGNNYNINIELKRTSTDEAIKKQLIRNRYYLNFLGKKVHNVTFVSDEKKLYSIDDKLNLITIDFDELTKILINQEVRQVENVNALFNPSNYLISPFNSTSDFIQKQYFLTAHQELIKSKSIDIINKKDASFLSICGRAGTGKTLLTYDIAKEYIDSGFKVLIVHCGILNSGHYELMDKHRWNVIPAKDILNIDISKFSLIIIDEVQRIYPNQLDFAITQIKKNAGSCIFSYDKQQWLRRWELNNNIEQRIINETSSKIFELTEKIRTNKEIATFIKSLFDKSKLFNKMDRSNIELSYFENFIDAKNFMELLGEEGWKIINFTSSNRHRHPYDDYSCSAENSSHEVIGQEFDKVIAVIDSHFYYKMNKLSTKGYRDEPYYHPTKMLFQIMTRTRKKLNVIVINNKEIMERCLSILN